MTTIERLANRYEILRPVARGGQACVYLVRELDTRREVALKLLEVPEGQKLAEWRARFRQEYHTAARLRHPNIVTTHDYGETETGVPFLTMEYLAGPGFDACLPMAPGLVLKHLPGLLRALAYLHAQGWVHMDLKPENLKLDASGETAKLMDLGLARRAGQIASGLAGTLAYVPPEAIRNAPVDRRSDLYALGAVLHHLLAGEPPFQGSPREVLKAHLEQPPPALPPEVPPALAEVVSKLMAKSPLERFGSANEVLAELGFTSEDEDAGAVFAPPVAGREAELRAMDESLGRIRRQGGYEELWLVGAPETELAALVDELRARAQLAGAWTLQLRPAARGGLEIFAPLAQALLTRLADQGEAALASARQALAPVLASEADPDADPAQERLRAFTALGQLMKLASARRPVALVVEPTGPLLGLAKEWLDHLHRLHGEAPILALVGTHEEPELEWRLDAHRQCFDLEPLEAGACAELTAAILGTRQVPEALARAAFAFSGGQPGKLHALLQALAAQGALRRTAGGWVVTVPDLEATLGALDPARAFLLRLAELQPLAAALLALLALLERQVPLWELWALLEAVDAQATEAAAHEALTELASLGLAALQPGTAALAREVDRAALESEFLAARAPGLLAALLPALEARWQEEPAAAERLQELARLAAVAGDPERAPRYGHLAASHLARAFALESAESVLAAALAASSPATPQATLRALWHLRGDVARDQGDRRLAERSYEAALGLASAPEAQAERARVLVGYGRLSWTRGELLEASARFAEARRLASELELGYEATLASTWLGRVALARGDAEAAFEVIPAALEAARAEGHQALVRENLAQWGYWLVSQGEGDPTLGLGMLSEALQLIARDEAKIELNACYALQGNALMGLGRYPEARLAFLRNRDLCAEIGAAPHDEAQAWMRCAAVDLEIGDFTSCRRAASPAGALARMVGDRALLVEVRLIEGLAALYQGDFTLYQDAGSAAAEFVQASDRPVLAAALTLRQAEAEAFLGQWSRALTLANEALGRMAPMPGHALAAQAQLLKAEALGHLGLARPARAALAALAEPRNEALAARRRLVEARLAASDGEPENAVRAASTAHGAARRGGLLPLAASAALLLASVAPEPEAALGWARKALIDAESCQLPALAAEALFQVARLSPGRAQAELFMDACEEAWARATSSFTPSQAAAFAAPEHRRALAEALQLRRLQSRSLAPADVDAVLSLLAAPPDTDPQAFGARMLEALGERLGARRLGLAIQAPSGAWERLAAWGSPEDDMLAPETEWERLKGLDSTVVVAVAPAVTAWAAGLSGGALARFEALVRALALPLAFAGELTHSAPRSERSAPRG